MIKRYSLGIRLARLLFNGGHGLLIRFFTDVLINTPKVGLDILVRGINAR